MSVVRLATRRSPLALAQAEFVRARLADQGVDAVLVTVETTGDRQRDRPLTDVAGTGVFAVEVQSLVLRGDADVAVHSAKDLPSTTPPGLTLASVPERRDPADVLVGRSMAGLGPGARVATGSPRRRALLLERRPDLDVVGLRGNMSTRLDAIHHDGIDAVVAAAAALERLGWSDRIAERLDVDWFIPQVGQGALALEARDDDEETRVVVASISDDSAAQCLRAERSFLRELGAGCTIPAAAHATWVGDELSLRALMAAHDGGRVLRWMALGTDPESLGVRVARQLRDEMGGANLQGWVAS